MEEQKSLTIIAQGESTQISLEDIKKYIAPGATDKELFIFVNTCRAYGLNPMKREAYFVKYGNNPGQTIVGYEMYIKRADRTGLLDGWDVQIGKDDIGEKATITIYRKDRAKHFLWAVYRQEFDSGQANWKKMPLFMLRKVAISQGFRLAFPDELGGMPYIPEEINGHISEELPRDEVATPAYGIQKGIEEAVFEIGECKTLEDLQITWEAIPKNVKKHKEVISSKDAKKAELSKPVEPETELDREPGEDN